MTISYNWLSDYLPVKIEPERLSKILTSIGLEVEKMETYEEVKGGMKGLVIGEVLEVSAHPNADKLRLTKVNTGKEEPLRIVCGAPNVAVGQKVVVASIGTTIYPVNAEPLTMKLTKIRGEESHGMICAEDEIGLGSSHAGIMVLKEIAQPGQPAEEYFLPYKDIIYEIGLTPNRMDAMSHAGVARDVCAYLTHHDKKETKPVLPAVSFKADNQSLKINVVIENKEACKRFAGVCLSGIKVKESPKWLQQRLKAIGLRPINNIVDITNYVLHETGQPLHAYDYDAIKGQKVIVKTESEGTVFVTLDEKERKLSGEDLMICNAEEGMCIAGVFGGTHSGVTGKTKNIFLESAWFDPVFIRKTSFRHGLRTDAATRFEKGVDISNTVYALKRAALLIKELGEGEIASDIIDIYPDPEPKRELHLKFQFLKKLSGKNYHPDTVKKILQSLGFIIAREDIDAIWVDVPYHKNDVSLPADLVEEILRIDGLDNIEIPTSITISPSVEKETKADELKEKIASFLVGLGFNEILTNSITNSKYFSEEQLQTTVKLLNNLSSELDVMRPVMLPTALEVIAFNQNRKNANLKLFEFGKTYTTESTGKYSEQNHLCLYITGTVGENHWKGKAQDADIFYIKGIAQAIIQLSGLKASFSVAATSPFVENLVTADIDKKPLVRIGKIAPKIAARFDVKQTVYFANFNWDVLTSKATQNKIQYKEIAKFPQVERDLAMVVAKDLPYEDIRKQITQIRLPKLQDVKLFDIFESEKIGKEKKSMAINLTFLDEEKTLTDKEIDEWMNKIITSLEKDLGAEIRK
jgi:phenylalanyl-tRNA synthetase beta chain